MSQYIGKTISLISNKGVRYVGLLYNISAEDATVALQSVRSFGTEGRMAEQGQPNLEVLPGTDVYDFVTFRGSDVKDLSVLDTPLDQVQPVPYQPATHALNAPAPAPATATSNQNAPQKEAPATTTSTAPATVSGTTQAKDGHVAAPGAVASAPEPTATATAPESPVQVAGAPRPTQATQTSQEQPTRTQTTANAAPGLVPQPVSQTSGPEKTDGEFDFEKANARFHREERDDADSKAVYNKSTSFFDSISLNDHGNMRWSEEKNLNMDTFGESSVRRGRGGWRGRGRGRGNWRGRGGNRGRGRAESKPEWA